MEEEKRKKKNKKKKKNKQQTKAAAAVVDDTASSNAGETSSVSGEQDNVSNSNIVIDETHVHNAIANGCPAVDSEKQHWLREEARLRDMVKQLLYEKDSCIQRQADLEIRLELLQSENDSWQHKEVSLEQRISELLQENAALRFEERNLLEKFQHVEKEKLFLVETKNSSKEIMATLNNENARLRMQVLELEGARDSLSHDNEQLLDNISTLQSQVQDLETSLHTVVSPAEAQKDKEEKEILNAELEGTYALIGKLMTENAELVEKVNVLSMELGRQAVVPDVTSVDIPDSSTADPVSISTKDIQEDISLSTKSVKPFGTVSIGDEQMATDKMDLNYADVVQHSADATVSGEIVQISLDENESQDLEAQVSANAGGESVPLADAPLIGAPYRLISFVAKYVSGADLVDKGSSNSLQ